MKSTFRNMVLVLFAITLICSAIVGVVNHYTAEPIAAAQVQKMVASVKAVLPAFTNNPVEDVMVVDGVNVYPAMNGYERVGYAIESTSSEGFNGDVKLMVGFDAAGNIVDIAVLEQAETPGLGAGMSETDNSLVLSFRSKDAAGLNMTVKQDGGDVDALTAATISSRAYTKAVEAAYEAFLKANTPADHE